MDRKCISCGIPLIGQEGVSFPCPHCGKGAIVRCSHCRNLGAKYECPECEFEGP